MKEKPSKKQSTTTKKEPPTAKDVPAGVLAFLGEENLDLFERDDVGAVLSQKPPRHRSDSDEDDS